MIKITKRKQGFILWDILISIFIVSLTSVLLGTWYINLVSINNYSTNKLKAINLASNYMEQFISKKIKQDFKKDIFDIYWQKKSVSSNLSTYTINVSWQEKTKKCNVQLSTIAFN